MVRNATRHWQATEVRHPLSLAELHLFPRPGLLTSFHHCIIVSKVQYSQVHRFCSFTVELAAATLNQSLMSTNIRTDQLHNCVYIKFGTTVSLEVIKNNGVH